MCRIGRTAFSKTCLVMVGLAASAGPEALAQDDPLIPGPAILRLPASVRSAGLNGAGAAIVGDAASIFANPAATATISYIALEGSFRTAPEDVIAASGAMAWRIRQFDFGFGVQYLDLGLNRTLVPPGAVLGPDESVEQLLAVGSLVYRFGIIAMGGSIKYLRQDVVEERERAFSADVGLAVALFDIMAMGFSVQNIEDNFNSSSSIQLPRLTRFGFTMNYVDPLESFRLMSTLEVQWPEGGDARAVLGGEGGVVLSGVGVVGRVAYGSESSQMGAAEVSYGGSLELGKVFLDYSYQTTDLFGEAVNRFGIRIKI